MEWNTTNEIIKIQEKSPRKEWWDDDCKEEIQEKNKAREKAMQIKTRATYEAYNQKRKEANKTCRNKKKSWMNNRINQLEDNFKKNDTRKFFKDVQNMKRQETGIPSICKDDKGNILAQQTKVLERWKEYFENIAQTKDAESMLKLSDLETNEIGKEIQELEPPTQNEINYIIQHLKPNKAAGSDNISPELIKHGGRTLKKKLYNLFLKIWREEEVE